MKHKIRIAFITLSTVAAPVATASGTTLAAPYQAFAGKEIIN